MECVLTRVRVCVRVHVCLCIHLYELTHLNELSISQHYKPVASIHHMNTLSVYTVLLAVHVTMAAGDSTAILMHKHPNKCLKVYTYTCICCN